MNCGKKSDFGIFSHCFCFIPVIFPIKEMIDLADIVVCLVDRRGYVNLVYDKTLAN